MSPARVGTQGTYIPAVPTQYFTNTGAVCNACNLHTYEAGTTTNLATYSDEALSVANANPIVLDSAGRATIFLSQNTYRFVLKDSTDATTLWDRDNIVPVPVSSGNIDVTGTAGEALALNDAVYLSDGGGARTAGRWYKTDSTNSYSASTVVVGFATAAIASSASGTIRVSGVVTGLSSLTAGTLYYLSAATAGAITSGAPASNRRVIGYALTTTTLMTHGNPDVDVVRHTGNIALASQAANDLFYATSATAITRLAAGTSGQLLRTTGAGSAPAWTTATFPATATGTGTILRADGTNWVATTATYPATTTINQLLYSSSANVVAGLASGNDGVVITSGAGVPSISSTLPTAVQTNITQTGTVTVGTWNAVPPVNLCEGRLTLTTAVPVTTADVTAATTLYFTPYRGNRCALYDGSTWTTQSFAERSIAVPGTTNQMYDIFLYDNSGTLTLELTAWTNDTTRATALVLQDGVYVKTGVTTRRYLGSFRTTGVAGQTEDSFANRLLWNYYNRVPRPLRVVEGTNTWAYTTATWRQANASAANQIAVVVGVAESLLEVRLNVTSVSDTNVVDRYVSIGADSTNTPASGVITSRGVSNQLQNVEGNHIASLDVYPAIGYHYYAWLEYSVASGITTWWGDNSDATLTQSGITGRIEN